MNDSSHSSPAKQPHWSKTTFRALRHRNFQLFFGGQFISLIGTWMQIIAEAWLVYRLTGSSLLLGAVGFAGRIPIFLLAPVGGLVADRWNRQKVVIATQSASMVVAFTLAGLALAHRLTVWEIMLLAALMGVVNAFDIPARQAFLVEMVEREDLLNAVALNSSMFNGARVAGPAVAGILVAALGVGWCFFANAASYIAVIIGLALMRIEKPTALEENESALENVIEGFQFARQTGPVWALLLLVGLVSFVAMPVTVLMPIFADRILHGGVEGLGWLMGATGVGALLGALALATRKDVRGLGRWVFVSAAWFGASLVLFGFSRWMWFSIAVLVPSGFFMMVNMAATNTLLQAMAPDRLRGRVMSLYSMMTGGMAPVGALIAGAAADRIGAPVTVALCGAACAVGAFWFWRHWPGMRESARELLVAAGMMTRESADEVPATGD
ncbi:MAG: MFS transporter [Candidatus Acidiferrales bacterium]